MSSPDEDSAKTRLLEAAKEEFLANGYAGANVGRIASTAGISKKTVYKYVSSKEALLYEVIASVLSGPAENLTHPTPGLDLAERLEAYLDAFTALAFSDQGVTSYRLLMAEGGRFPELAQAYVNSLTEHAVKPLANELAVYARQGKIALDDCHLAAKMLFSMVAAETLRDATIGVGQVPDEPERKRMVRQALRLFLHGATSV